MIRCPAGHELQAAKTDLGKPLCCPVCNQTFTLGGGAAAAPAPNVPASGAPTRLDYADGRIGLPVSRPGYVGWLIGFWIVVVVAGAVYNFASMGLGSDPQNPNPLHIAGSCFVGMGAIVAIVLQLMWIYRIHSDALRARGYREVSPGMALGLSFIPFFNYIWTGWTMKKLASFASGEGALQGVSASEAVRAATLCFGFGIAMATMSCIAGTAGAVVGFQAAMQAGPGGPVDPFATAGSGFYALMVLSNLVSLAATFVYVWAVRKLHHALYDFLGAA